MFPTIAKNVGVRRARGQFVLETNIGIVFSDALFFWIGRRILEQGVMYRCDRVDVVGDVPEGKPLDVQLDYCAHAVIRVAKRDGKWLVPLGLAGATIADARPVPPPPHEGRRGGRLLGVGQRWSQRLEAQADRLVELAHAFYRTERVPSHAPQSKMARKKLSRARIREAVKICMILAGALAWFSIRIFRRIARRLRLDAAYGK